MVAAALGARGVVVDGNDQVWISNFGSGGSITHLCGARNEICPPGMKTGDPISPPGGYVGGGMQSLTDIAVDPAGNVWVADNWQRPDSCFSPSSDEAKSTLCGGNGLTVFYGMAKPVRSPQIGPARIVAPPRSPRRRTECLLVSGPVADGLLLAAANRDFMSTRPS